MDLDPDPYAGEHADVTDELRLAAAHIRTAADLVAVSTERRATLRVDAHHYLMSIQRAYLSLVLAVGGSDRPEIRALS